MYEIEIDDTVELFIGFDVIDFVYLVCKNVYVLIGQNFLMYISQKPKRTHTVQ